MAAKPKFEPLDAAMAEYEAIFSPDWKKRTLTKYEAEFRDFRAWLVTEKRALTTESLDFGTLLAYVAHLKAKPAVRNIWRGDREAVAHAAGAATVPRSLNTVGSSMRTLRAFVLWLHEDGRLPVNPFARKNRRGGQNPLLPPGRHANQVGLAHGHRGPRAGLLRPRAARPARPGDRVGAQDDQRQQLERPTPQAR